MKKGLVLTLSAVLCLSSYISIMPAMPISSQSEGDQADAFLSRYAGVEVTTTVGGKQAGTTFSWFREASPSNAAIIAEGYKVYQGLSVSVQKEIQAAYQAQKINYATLCAAALALLEPAEQPAAPQQTAAAPDTQQEPVSTPDSEIEKANLKAGTYSARKTAAQNESVDSKSADTAGSKASAPAEESAGQKTESSPASRARTFRSGTSSSGTAGTTTAASADQNVPADPEPENEVESSAAYTADKTDSSVADKTDTGSDDVNTGENAAAPEESAADAQNSAKTDSATTSDASESSKTDSQASSSDDPAAKKPVVLPEVGSVTADGKEVLYSSSLEAGDEDIVLQVAGKPVELSKGEAEAVNAWMIKQGITSYEVYGDVIYSAIHDGRNASSVPMLAVKAGDQVMLFTLSYIDARSCYELVQYSIDAISFDFITGTLNPIVKSTFTYAYTVQPEVPETQPDEDEDLNPDSSNPDDTSPEDSNTQDQPQTPENPSTPSSPEPDTSQPDPEDESQSSGDIQAEPNGPGSSTNINTNTDNTGNSNNSAGGNTASENAGTSAAVPDNTVQNGNSSAAVNAAVQEKPNAQANAELEALNKGQAATFIKTYITGADGNVYTSANAYNYRQILNGYNSWKKLSQAVRYEISSTLKNMTGKSYANLFTEANRIRLNQVQGGGAVAGGLPVTTVNPQTATDSFAPVHIFSMMMSSLGFFVSLLRKKDII